MNAALGTLRGVDRQQEKEAYLLVAQLGSGGSLDGEEGRDVLFELKSCSEVVMR